MNNKLKICNINSIYLKKNQKKRNTFKKFDFYDCLSILEKNNHKGRHETAFEEDFSSSDSYDSDFFSLKKKAPKKLKLKSRKDLKDNEDNFLEIIRVLNNYQS